MQTDNSVLRTAREVAAERIALHGNVKMGDFLARIPSTVDDTYTVIDQLVAAGELVETTRTGPKPADRTFIYQPRG